jgi:Tfp pilus assembly protein PilX
VAEKPKYAIELLTKRNPDTSIAFYYFRITARGVGGSNTAVVILQTIHR